VAADGDGLAARLPAVVEEATGVAVDRISGLTALSGGASRDSWSFDAELATGEVARLVLQRRRSVAIAPGLSVDTEAVLLQQAHAAGAPVARLVGWDPTGEALGAPFLLVERVDGETIPQRILRDPTYADARGHLVRDYGAALARLHRTPVDEVPGLASEDPLAQYRRVLDEIDEPHPALELGLRWLVRHQPPPGRRVLVHGDFRSGNGIVTRDGLAAVIDFELAHVGDPLEDLGWFCIRAWRFGEPLQAGGFGTIEEFVDAYRGEGGDPVDLDALRWWVVFGTIRWAVICLIQGATHVSGHRRSIELAAVGRRVCEPELDLMLLLP
jgi:aminoglycoside phosphotransferase (APT) family kinase protein